MKKVSYIGNGKIREFYFNFPYYENSNIVVTMNGAAATGIEVIGNQGGLDADFPFIGGCVVFNTAPRDTDTITIARVLPLSRVVDYQQMVRIDPHTLNMDINYIKEIIDDLSDEIHEMAEQSKPDEIREMLEKIDALNARIDALGDISDIRDNIATNTDDIATNRDNIATNTGDIATNRDDIAALDTRTDGMIDYVVASQSPTAENNYTWYRKYKSGWVEQGGYSDSQTVNLPIEMADTNYTIQITGQAGVSNNNVFVHGWRDRTTTSFITQCNILNNNGGSAASNTNPKHWQVCGKMAV
ncbi:MAG: hypothetical protein ACLRFM_03085 [Alphaproteobacteria bacterium]